MRMVGCRFKTVVVTYDSLANIDPLNNFIFSSLSYYSLSRIIAYCYYKDIIKDSLFYFAIYNKLLSKENFFSFNAG